MFERDFATESAPTHRASRGHFRGVWHARSERVVGTLREVSLAPQTRDRGELLGRDIAEFNAVLFDVYKRGCSAGAIFTLHFDAFCDDTLNQHCMLALRQTPARLLPFVTPRLVGIDAETPIRLVERRVRQLQSLFRKVIIETCGDAERFATLRQATLATSWQAIAQRGDAASAARRFRRFAKDGAHATLMTGVDCGASFEIASAAGFDTLAGGRIGCFERPLAEQYALTRAQIAEGD